MNDSFDLAKRLEDVERRLQDLERRLRAIEDKRVGLIKTDTSTGDKADRILRIVSTYYGLHKEQLFVKSKASDFVLPRHMAMYMLSRHTSMLTVQIARLFSCAYRSAHYGIERILTGMQYDERIRRDTVTIDNLLKENILDVT